MSDRIIFVVFHQGIAPELTRTQKYPDIIRYFGVNQDYDKYVLTSQGNLEALNKRDDVQLEYQLPYYDPSLQKNGFMETSAYIHIYKNQLHLPYKFVGITQYDMVWSDEVVRRVKSVKQQNEVLAKTQGLILSEREWSGLMFPEERPLEYIIESYNNYFGTNSIVDELEGRPLTLWQTYFMHRSVFEDLAGWLSVLVQEVYPWASRPPYPTHWGFIGGLTERAESIFFALRKDLYISEIGLQHSGDIVKSLKITKKHYGTNQSLCNKHLLNTFKKRAGSFISKFKENSP